MRWFVIPTMHQKMWQLRQNYQQCVSIFDKIPLIQIKTHIFDDSQSNEIKILHIR